MSAFTTENHTDELTETAAAVAAGMAMAEPVQLDVSEDAPLHVIMRPAGAVAEVIDVRPIMDKFAPHPRRKTGTFTVLDARSFTDYMAKHGLLSSEVWADPDHLKVVGVIDAHDFHDILAPDAPPIGPGEAGHGEHRVVLSLVSSAQWKAWIDSDGDLMARDDFAEFIETNAADVIDPDSATMLEIAQGFHATVSADVKNVQRLTSGQLAVRYEETIDARAGEAGELEIPTRFTIEIPVFTGGASTALDVRLRYRLRAGSLRIGYKLVDRAGDIQRAMFNDTAAAIAQTVTQPVFLGTSA